MMATLNPNACDDTPRRMKIAERRNTERDSPTQSDKTVEQILYELHGYDKREVPLLDAQIKDVVAALTARENRMVQEAKAADVEKWKSLCGCPMCTYHSEAYQLTHRSHNDE